MMTVLSPKLPESGTWVGRIQHPDGRGPAVVTVRDEALYDITSRQWPTLSELLEADEPVAAVQGAAGEVVASLTRAADVHWLAPCDLQAIKACGVTFARSLIERVIEERAVGDPAQAETVRERITGLIGEKLSDVEPGSTAAMQVKHALIEAGLWSPYLEVGIGPDAEVFTKCQPMSAVGFAADVGVHPMSSWNNPEPEIVLAVNSRGKVQGATLGNDVNLRDVEGRSALLLGKAKDNNASCAIGPMLRLFDDSFGIDDVRSAELELVVEGEDGFRLEGRSSMREISRDPLDIVAQTIGRHHQYPDGMMLFLGTLFAPTEDRDIPGEGFTHQCGDQVTITCSPLGCLINRVQLSTDCPAWTFGTRSLMYNLAARQLI